jgi:hypothetical protein
MLDKAPVDYDCRQVKKIVTHDKEKE